jgi:hypothetical protein
VAKTTVAKPQAKPKATSTLVSTPSVMVPQPPPPPPPRDELPAERDVGRLLRYGERFGPHKIDVRMWSVAGALQPTTLAIPSGELAVFDPGVPKSWRVLDRPAAPGHSRIMLSVARTEDRESLAAVIIHTGRPPIARWTIAHVKGQKKKSDGPTVTVTSGWVALMDAGGGPPGVLAIAAEDGIQPIEVPLTDGRRALALPSGNGEFTAYWAVDAADKPICLVIDFDAFTQKEWKAKPAT